MRHRFLAPLTLIALCSTLLVTLSGCGFLSTVGGANTNFLPPNMPRSTPAASTFQNCPPQGQGGDPALNALLNRTDDSPPGGYRQTDLATVITTPTTPQADNTPRSAWTADTISRVGRYEGAAIRTTGWVVAARELGPDPANCQSDVNRDWALWISTGAGDAMATSFIAIVTPRVRALRPGWTDFSMRRIVGQVVRLSGFLVYYQTPSPLVGANRASPWAIGPVIHLEAYYQNQWINLDLLPFGPRTSGTPQAGAGS